MTVLDEQKVVVANEAEFRAWSSAFDALVTREGCVRAAQDADFKVRALQERSAVAGRHTFYTAVLAGLRDARAAVRELAVEGVELAVSGAELLEQVRERVAAVRSRRPGGEE